MAARDLMLFSVNGVKLVLDALAAAFADANGHGVTISLDEAGVLRRRIEAGDAFDVCILPRAALAALCDSGRIVAGSATDIVRAEFGIGIRAGAARPVAPDADAFRDWLLHAGTIVQTDPATGGVSGVFFDRMLQELGVRDALRSRTRFTAGVLNASLVAAGTADLAVQMRHEIVAVPGIEFVPFPPAFRAEAGVMFTAGASAVSTAPDAAGALVRFLAGPVAAAMFHAKGMQPIVRSGA